MKRLRILSLCLCALMLLTDCTSSSAPAQPVSEPTTVSIQLQPAPSQQAFLIGKSTNGRSIDGTLWSSGQGQAKLLIVGGIHSGTETNTVELAEQLVAYVSSQQDIIPENFTLYILPNLNPDGYALGSRFNARDVDLNRNWDCKWERFSKHNARVVSGGDYAMSEMETQALRDFVQSQDIDVVIFLHSAAGKVSSGVCGTNTELAAELGTDIAAVTGYGYDATPFYDGISGDATGYFNQHGRVAVEIELSNHTETDLRQNIAGLIAAIGWTKQHQP